MADNVFRLDDSWGKVKKIAVWGYGRHGRRIVDRLQNDFEITAVVDNAPHKAGTTPSGIPVIRYGDAEDVLRNNKVVVTTQNLYYQQIKVLLDGIGMTEDRDYTTWRQFIAEWYYRYRGQICMPKTDISITPQCTLNCEKCQLFMPYWKNRRQRRYETIKEDADLYFRCVDYVFDMDIVGGEPLLHTELAEILGYIGKNYRDKIGYLGLITNGTLVPPQEVVSILKEYGIGVSISDYSRELHYDERIGELCSLLEGNGIQYFRNSNIEWFDFGFPGQVFHYTGEKAAEHMRCCGTVCHALRDKKFYYCGIASAAYQAGLFPEETYGAVELPEIKTDDIDSRKALLECCLGDVGVGALKFCGVCGGFGNDNPYKVEVARQLSRKNGHYGRFLQ